MTGGPQRLSVRCRLEEETFTEYAATGETRRVRSIVMRSLVTHWPSVLASANPLRKG